MHKNIKIMSTDLQIVLRTYQLYAIHHMHKIRTFISVKYMSILPISFSVAALALGQSGDCPNASAAALMNMG